MMRRILLILCMLLLAACGGAATQAPPTAGIASAPTTAPEPTALPAPTDAPQATSAPAPSAGPAGGESQGDVLVVYQKTGGIAGLDNTLTVYADGRFAFADKRGGTQAGQAAPAALEELKQLLVSPEFAALDPSYDASGADLFTYKIELPGAGKTVVTMDNAGTPPVLAQAIEKLEALVTPKAPAS